LTARPPPHPTLFPYTTLFRSLGAWICIWGCGMLLTSAPFDNWWHNAYGLDVRIISPPHAVLAVGIFSIVIGAVLLCQREQERAEDRKSTRLNSSHSQTSYAVF